MSRVAILGTATADQIFRSEAGFEPGRTVIARRLRSGAGGAPLYAGAALMAGGYEVSPLFDVGDDEGGDAILAACRAANLSIDAVRVQTGGATPACLLVYSADSRDSCLFDPGRLAQSDLTPVQRHAARRAEWIMISAAPAARVAQMLAGMRDGQRLAWIYKSDPDCFPEPLCERLMRRADIVFYNRAESALVDRWAALADPRTVLVKTLGGDGVCVTQSGQAVLVPVDALDPTDPTGAGDTFAGHMLAAILNGADPIAAARIAIGRTAAFLAARP